jgi:hypothetical protein
MEAWFMGVAYDWLTLHNIPLLPHPAYSMDKAPSDVLFPKLKSNQKRKIFQ